MSGVNGPDIAAVYQLLTEVARRVAGHDDKFDTQDRKLDAIIGRLDAHDRKFAEHDRKLDNLAAGLSSLREAVTHGILISELDERLRRIERHLAPSEA
jgi:hypothetical protein